MLEISAPDSSFNDIKEIAEKHGVIDMWHSAKNKDGRRTVSILTHLEYQQELTDDLQKAMRMEDNWRVVVVPVDATIPKHEKKEQDEDSENGKGKKIVRGALTREELYNDVERGANLNLDFALLVLLSTIVCAIGLIKSNVAVIIGAMVIAPLLGPNLALSFGSALGDRELIFKAAKVNICGLAMTISVSVLAGFIFNLDVIGTELIDRTEVGFDILALALASGAAAVLSLTTGLSATLVGVMVAVALMPPAVALGLMLGMGQISDAYGASLLLAANIVCINLAAQLVFFLKGIRPRTWYELRQSRQSLKITFAFWIALLIAVSGLIALRDFQLSQLRAPTEIITDPAR